METVSLKHKKCGRQEDGPSCAKALRNAAKASSNISASILKVGVVVVEVARRNMCCILASHKILISLFYLHL